MESFENRRCHCVTVCDNSSKCVLNTPQFVLVETGQTSEERVEVIKVTTHQLMHESPEWQLFGNTVMNKPWRGYCY